MGRYNIGDKFVVEIKSIEDGGLYRISESEQDVTREETLDHLDILNYEYVNENFGELQNEAFAAGQKDAWNVAKKIFGMGEKALLENDVKQIFGCNFRTRVLMDYTADQAKRMIEKHEQTKWLEVGDIVTTQDGKAVVIGDSDRYYNLLLLETETIDKVDKGYSYITGKTGRKIDIYNLLKEAAGIPNKNDESNEGGRV